MERATAAWRPGWPELGDSNYRWRCRRRRRCCPGRFWPWPFGPGCSGCPGLLGPAGLRLDARGRIQRRDEGRLLLNRLLDGQWRLRQRGPPALDDQLSRFRQYRIAPAFSVGRSGLPKMKVIEPFPTRGRHHVAFGGGDRDIRASDSDRCPRCRAINRWLGARRPMRPMIAHAAGYQRQKHVAAFGLRVVLVGSHLSAGVRREGHDLAVVERGPLRNWPVMTVLSPWATWSPVRRSGQPLVRSPPTHGTRRGRHDGARGDARVP